MSLRRVFSRLLPFALALAATLAATVPAEAGRWVTGGTFDPNRGVGVSFLRFLSEPGEGQMTIRCDALDGLWLDAGVSGNGALPEGTEPGDMIAAEFAFIRDGEPDVTVVSGELLVRTDGAVLVTIVGEEAMPLAPALLIPAERIDITIAGITRPIPMADVTGDIESLAERCDGWPQ